MCLILFDCLNHRDTVASSENKHLELFIEFLHLVPLMVIPSSIHNFCLFFPDEEIHIHCIDIKWLSVCDYLDSSSWLEGF